MPGLIPASRLEQFDVLAPANRAKANPLEVATPWPAGELVAVKVRIPRGANGLVGFQILYAHGQAIPTTQGAWIVGNDETFEADVMGHLNGGQWSVNVYNLDRVPHTLHVTYYVADLSNLGGQLLSVPSVTPELT